MPYASIFLGLALAARVGCAWAGDAKAPPVRLSWGESLSLQLDGLAPMAARPEEAVMALRGLLASPELQAAPRSPEAEAALVLGRAVLAPHRLPEVARSLRERSPALTPELPVRLAVFAAQAREAGSVSLSALRETVERLESLASASAPPEASREALERLYGETASGRALQETGQGSPRGPPAADEAACRPPARCPLHFLWGGKGKERAQPPAPGLPLRRPERLHWLRFAWWSLSSLRDPLGVLIKIHETYGDGPVEVRFPTGHRWIFASDPDVVSFALKRTTELEDAPMRKSELQSFPIAQLVGRDNLFLSEGPSWHRSRRLLNPLFRYSAVNSAESYEGMLRAIDARLDGLRRRAAAEGGAVRVDLPRELTRLTLDVLLQNLFRARLSEARLAELSEAYGVVMRWLSVEAANPVRVGLRRLPSVLPGQRGLKRAYAVIDAAADEIIAGHPPRAAGEAADLLDLLAESRDEEGKPLSREALRSQVHTMLLAGHETTATLLSWSFYGLHAHPPAMRRLQEEVDASLGSRRAVTPADLRGMPFLGQTVTESLRLFSPAYVIARRAARESRVPTTRGIVVVPAGAQLILTPFMTHRREEDWGEERTGHPASDFRPERYDAAPVTSPQYCRTFPFGFGPRVCIGKDFASAEAKLILARFLQEFEVRPAEPGQASPRGSDISVRLTRGWPVVLSPRR